MLTLIFSPIIDNITQILELSIILLTKNKSLKHVFNTGENSHYNNRRTWKDISTKNFKNKLTDERSYSCISLGKVAKPGVEKKKKKKKVMHENHYWQKERRFRNYLVLKMKIAHELQKAGKLSLSLLNYREQL